MIIPPGPITGIDNIYIYIIDTSIDIFKTVAKFFLNSLADLRLEGQIGWPVALPIRGYYVGTPDWNCHWPANLTTHRPEIFP